MRTLTLSPPPHRPRPHVPACDWRVCAALIVNAYAWVGIVRWGLPLIQQVIS